MKKKFQAQIVLTVQFSAEDYNNASAKLARMVVVLVENSLTIKVAEVVKDTLMEIKE
jgi:hypothetical protein